MIKNKKIVVVMPAYNAEKTLEQTYSEIPFAIIDDVILVDDYSLDNTYDLALKLGIKKVIRHEKNKGYGGNQKTCYAEALALRADIVVMLHPDYQYTPLLLEGMVYPIANGLYDVMLGTRIIGKGALVGGMPLYKYFFNRILTIIENICLSQKLSEYHTGYRAFSKEVLAGINMENNSDDFVFDNEMLAQIIYQKFRIGEISCPTKYFPEASSINLSRSMKYGFGVLRVCLFFLLHKLKIRRSMLFRD